MMNSQCYTLCAAMLTAMLITSQSEFTLVLPVWAIVVVSSALPVVMILAAMVCIEAFAAAVLRRHARRFCLAMEGIATMLADKLLGLAFLGDAIASTAAVVPMVAGANIKSERLATLFTDKLNEWVLSMKASLVPVRVILASVLCPKTGTAAILEQWGGATYLAVKEFATMVTKELTREAVRGLVRARTFLATVLAGWSGRIGLKAESLAAMFANSYYWRLFEAHDSTSGYASGFDVGAHLPEMVLVDS